MRTLGFALLAASVAAAEGSLDRAIGDYAEHARPGALDHAFALRFDVWMPVSHGDVANRGGPIDLRRDLSLGLLDESWQGLAVPLVGGAVGAAFGFAGRPNRPEELLFAAAVGAVVAPLLVHPAYDLTAQYSVSAFGVRLDGFYFDTDGENTLERNIAFGGASFPAGTNVESDFRVVQARLMLLWTFAGATPPEDDETPPLRDPMRGTDDPRVAVSILGGFAWVGYELAIRGGGTAGSAREAVLLPQVGLSLEARSGHWVFQAGVAGGGDGTSTWGDARVSAAYVFGDVFSIRGGYRFVYADLDSDGFAWAGYLEGFSLGCGLHF